MFGGEEVELDRPHGGFPLRDILTEVTVPVPLFYEVENAVVRVLFSKLESELFRVVLVSFPRLVPVWLLLKPVGEVTKLRQTDVELTGLGLLEI